MVELLGRAMASRINSIQFEQGRGKLELEVGEAFEQVWLRVWEETSLAFPERRRDSC